jgi:ribulose-5-phosphate 4-epimerase/fuculose-1-phosphate aldolase
VAVEVERVTAAEDCYGIVLRNHGAIAVGSSIKEAYFRTLSIEEQAALFGKRGDARLLKGRIQLSLGREDDGMAVLQQVITEFTGTELATQARFIIANYYMKARGPGEEKISEQPVAFTRIMFRPTAFRICRMATVSPQP